MRRTGTFSLAIALLILFGGTLIGCDETPTSVQDLDIQPALSSPSGVSLSLTGEPTTSFNVTYQGFDAHPTATGGENLTVEKVSEDGSPSEGEQTWEASFDGQISGIINRELVVSGPSGDRTIADTISVTISRATIIRQFTNDFFVAADYEDDDRSYSSSGGTTIVPDTLGSVTEVNSSGTAFIEVQSAPSGAATVTRRTSAANADRFSFLIRPSSSTDFNLTLTFTEEAGGGTETHDITLPVNSGNQWFRYQVGLDQVSTDFDPVAQRAGGDGPFVDVSMSTDKQVTFAVDEFRFESPSGPVADIHDFDKTNLAYGPPFCPPSFGATTDVAETSDGFTARTVEGSGCFGYNYNSYPAVNVDVDGNDVLTFRVNSSAGSDLEVFVQTGGQGGFGGAVTRTLPTGGWTTVEIPISELGSAPSALNTPPGIRNFGFTAGEGADFAIDDIRIESRD